MHIDLLLDIIQKGVEELKQITDNFKTEVPHPQEIDIATSKTQTLHKELQLLHSKVKITDSPDKVITNTNISEAAPNNTDNNQQVLISKPENNTEYHIKEEEPISYKDDSEYSSDKKDKVIGEAISPSQNLKELININDKFQFTRELFDNNSTLYNETIDKLNTASSFENAKKIISSFDWKEEEQTVTHFIEIITRKFNHNV